VARAGSTWTEDGRQPFESMTRTAETANHRRGGPSGNQLGEFVVAIGVLSTYQDAGQA